MAHQALRYASKKGSLNSALAGGPDTEEVGAESLCLGDEHCFRIAISDCAPHLSAEITRNQPT